MISSCSIRFLTCRLKPEDIRVDRELGGGPIYDIGVYCINAARYLLRSEPTEVNALHANTGDPRFHEVEEATGAILRFPGDRLASFSFCSFWRCRCRVLSDRRHPGRLARRPGVQLSRPAQTSFDRRRKDEYQNVWEAGSVAPELLYFSDCILNDKQPEPSGEEGLADVRIIRAIHRSAASRRSISLDATLNKPRPDLSQEEYRSPVSEPELVHTESPSQ